MKTKVLAILFFVGIVPVFAEVAKLKPNPKPDPVYKLKYKELKKSLEITDKELTPVEVLEVIALRYAEMLDKAQENFNVLDRRISELEKDSVLLKTELDKTNQRLYKAEQNIITLNATVKAQNEDLDKIFDWSSKVDDELFNGSALGAIGGIRQSVKKNTGNIESNAADIQALSRDIRNQQQAINNLSWAIRNLR